jgi:hypothetical protein
LELRPWWRPTVGRQPTGGSTEMALWIVVGMVGALALGYPMLLVLVIGAIAMAALAYSMSRDRRIARIGIGFGMLVFNHLIIQDLAKTQPSVDFPALVLWLASDNVLAVFACVTMVMTIFLGLFGPVLHIPLDIKEVVKIANDHDKNRGPDNKH